MARFDVPDIAARVRRRGVALRDTRGFYQSQATPREFILRFSALGERALVEGVRRLAG